MCGQVDPNTLPRAQMYIHARKLHFYAKIAKKALKRAFFKVFTEKTAIFVQFLQIL